MVNLPNRCRCPATYLTLLLKLASQDLNLISVGTFDTIEVSDGDQSIFFQEVSTGWEEGRHRCEGCFSRDPSIPCPFP